MRPIKTVESNYNFGPPQGHEESVGDLPCSKQTDDELGSVVYSVWEPTDFERHAILSGQNLRIGVFGLGGRMVPISLGITHLGSLRKMKEGV